MARLLLVDTSDELPGLLPLHAWSALMSSDLVVVAEPEHPFVAHLEAAGLRWEVVAGDEPAGLSRSDLLSGLTPADKARAESIVDRARAAGEVADLFGPVDEEGFTRTLGMEAARAGVEVEVVYFGAAPKGVRLLELVQVESRLRGPDGCPWDRQQDHASLARYAVEEVCELQEAIAAGDADAVREELGDVLLQVVFHAQIAEDAGHFDVDDVAGGIADKLVRRHPHVFGDVTVADADEVMANWEELKAAEKPDRDGVFTGIASAQPALGYVAQLQTRAARAGFDWDADAEAAQRVHQELEEFLVVAGSREGQGQQPARAALEAELGDLLMSVVGLARRHGLDPELAARRAAGRFRRRFEAAMAAAPRPAAELSRQDWLRLWDAAKAAERA